MTIKPSFSSPFIITGKVVKITGHVIVATGIRSPIGSLCKIEHVDGDMIAEIIGFDADYTYLMTSGDLAGLTPASNVIPLNKSKNVPVGDGLLGRVIDSQGEPLDSLGPLQNVSYQELKFEQINPLQSAIINQPFDVGIKAINGLLTMGRGQRIGLFAGSGIGKSVLLGMISRFSSSDINVISLVGERGREVKEFIEDNMGPQGLKKSIIIAAPADTSPLCRIQAAELATSIAEYYRSQKKHVLFMMDSITRYAHALRELGLSMGEPPTQKGYPPSVFARIPRLIERTGNGLTNESSITAIYTVLADGDDVLDPIVDSARGILDGHIVLSRKLAEENHYPAISIDQSISRVMDKVVSQDHLKLARTFKRSLSRYASNKDYIMLGAYQKGHDLELDKIIENNQSLYDFLKQDPTQRFSFSDTVSMLNQISLIRKSES